jgi:hypothetical protein
MTHFSQKLGSTTIYNRKRSLRKVPQQFQKQNFDPRKQHQQIFSYDENGSSYMQDTVNNDSQQQKVKTCTKNNNLLKQCLLFIDEKFDFLVGQGTTQGKAGALH